MKYKYYDLMMESPRRPTKLVFEDIIFKPSMLNVNPNPKNPLALDLDKDLQGLDSTQLSKLTKPIQPGDEDCCMSGCAICVWDVYNDELKAYADAVRKLGGDVPEQEPTNPSIDAFLEFEKSLKNK